VVLHTAGFYAFRINFSAFFDKLKIKKIWDSGYRNAEIAADTAAATADIRSVTNCGRAYLAECFDPGDDATHYAAYHATDRIPTAHPQATEGATGHTEQDVTDRML